MLENGSSVNHCNEKKHKKKQPQGQCNCYRLQHIGGKSVTQQQRFPLQKSIQNNTTKHSENSVFPNTKDRKKIQ
jgi:hypothetical protein